MTGQHRVVARVLAEARDHPDAVELHRCSAAIDSRVSLSTVYRTVKRPEHEGIIEKRYQSVVETSRRGSQVGGTSTPTFFSNGRKQNGAMTLEPMDRIIEPMLQPKAP